VTARGVLAAALAVAVAACSGGSARRGPDIPVGTLGLPYEVDSDQVTSFICANEKHFTLGYLDWGIVFSTGIGGVIPMRISGSTAGVRYDGGNFTVITMANRATVYYNDEFVMQDCLAIMQ
jgi:membrane-bound inhibitor of C-type lysozyme